MFKWIKEQKILKEKMKDNPNFCSCGRPIPPHLIHLKEGFMIHSRVYYLTRWTCNCGKYYDLVE